MSRKENEELKRLIKNCTIQQLRHMMRLCELELEGHNITLGEATAEFLDFKRYSVKPKSFMHLEIGMQFLIEYFGDKALLLSITRLDMRKFKSVLNIHPRDRNKTKRFKGMTFKDFEKVDCSKVDWNRFSTSTKHTRMGNISSFFNWCVNETRYLRDNPAQGLQSSFKLPRGLQRDPYTLDQISRLFNTEDYYSATADRPSRFWIPLILLHTGATPEEIAQMEYTDVMKKDAGFIFRITDRSAFGTPKSLKRHARERDIPIHSNLTQLGFIKYWKKRKKTHHDTGLLFPDLWCNGVPKRASIGLEPDYSGALGKWWNRYRKQGDKAPAPNQPLRAMRQTVLSLLKEQDVRLDVVRDIAGHAHKDSLNRHYTGSTKLSKLKQTIELLEFDLEKLKIAIRKL